MGKEWREKLFWWGSEQCAAAEEEARAAARQRNVSIRYNRTTTAAFFYIGLLFLGWAVRKKNMLGNDANDPKATEWDRWVWALCVHTADDKLDIDIGRVLTTKAFREIVPPLHRLGMEAEEEGSFGVCFDLVAKREDLLESVINCIGQDTKALKERARSEDSSLDDSTFFTTVAIGKNIVAEFEKIARTQDPDAEIPLDAHPYIICAGIGVAAEAVAQLESRE